MFTTGHASDAGNLDQPNRDRLIQKPFVPSTLLLKVRQVLDQPTSDEHAVRPS